MAWPTPWKRTPYRPGPAAGPRAALRVELVERLGRGGRGRPLVGPDVRQRAALPARHRVAGVEVRVHQSTGRVGAAHVDGDVPAPAAAPVDHAAVAASPRPVGGDVDGAAVLAVGQA